MKGCLGRSSRNSRKHNTGAVREKVNSSSWVLWIILGALFGFGVLGIIVAHKHPELEYLRPFGEAFLISALLGATVDRYVKQRLLRETSRDVAKYLIGYDLPKEVQDKIHELMETSIIREGCEVRYKLYPPKDGRVLIEEEWSFHIVNYSNTPKDYPHSIAVEKHDNPEFLELRCHSDDPKAAYCWGQERLRGQTSESEPGVLLCTGKKLKIRPRVDGFKYLISSKYRITVPEEASDIINFFGPAVGITVIADCSPELEFSAPAATVSTANRWEYQGIFLPGQHVHVRWFPKLREEPG